MGKVPFLEVDGTRLRESDVILEYLEEAYPQKPLLPKDPLARAQVRELVTVIELHLELVARRLYPGAFFGGTTVRRDQAIGRKGPRQGRARAQGAREIRALHRGRGIEPRRLRGGRAPADRHACDEAHLRARFPRGAGPAEALPQDARRAAGVRESERATARRRRKPRPRRRRSSGTCPRACCRAVPLSGYARFVVTLTAVVDPFLAVPIFLAVTGARSDEERMRLVNVVTFTVFVVLAGLGAVRRATRCCWSARACPRSASAAAWCCC